MSTESTREVTRSEDEGDYQCPLPIRAVEVPRIMEGKLNCSRIYLVDARIAERPHRIGTSLPGLLRSALTDGAAGGGCGTAQREEVAEHTGRAAGRIDRWVGVVRLEEEIAGLIPGRHPTAGTAVPDHAVDDGAQARGVRARRRVVACIGVRMVRRRVVDAVRARVAAQEAAGGGVVEARAQVGEPGGIRLLAGELPFVVQRAPLVDDVPVGVVLVADGVAAVALHFRQDGAETVGQVVIRLAGLDVGVQPLRPVEVLRAAIVELLAAARRVPGPGRGAAVVAVAAAQPEAVAVVDIGGREPVLRGRGQLVERVPGKAGGGALARLVAVGIVGVRRGALPRRRHAAELAGVVVAVARRAGAGRHPGAVAGGVVGVAGGLAAAAACRRAHAGQAVERVQAVVFAAGRAGRQVAARKRLAGAVAVRVQRIAGGGDRA